MLNTVEVEQPESWEFHGEDEVFIKQMYLAKAGYIVPQHAHKYAHTSMLATGSIRLWKDGELVGDFKAPTGITIVAHTKHTMQSLEDATTIYCVHNTHGFTDDLEGHLVEEHHHLEDEHAA